VGASCAGAAHTLNRARALGLIPILAAGVVSSAAASSSDPLPALQEFGVDLFAELQLEESQLEGPELEGPQLRLEVGRSPTRAGFALDLFGGAPNGWALLELEQDGVRMARELVRLDESGAARILRLDHRAATPIDVTCTLPVAAADVWRSANSNSNSNSNSSVAATTVTRRVQVPSAASMIAQSRTLAGWGAPGSPFAASSAAGTGLVITEIMKDPTSVSDAAGEWFEVRNLGPTPIDLSGWVIRDSGSNSHTIPATAGAVVPQRSYFIFGNNATPALNGGVNVGYRYSSFTLGNGADDIQLLDAGGLLVDAVAYDDGVFWPDTPGAAMNLQRALVDTTLNDDGGNWCNSLNPISATNSDTGTPRVANNTCP
jgi:hypothetical protein